MKPVLLGAASLIAAWAGMTILCFGSGSQRHRMRLPEQNGGQRRWHRATGAVFLSLSLAAAIAADGASFGIVLWICQTGVAGLVLTCVLPYSLAWVVHAQRAAIVLAPVLLAAAYGF